MLKPLVSRWTLIIFWLIIKIKITQEINQRGGAKHQKWMGNKRKGGCSGTVSPLGGEGVYESPWSPSGLLLLLYFLLLSVLPLWWAVLYIHLVAEPDAVSLPGPGPHLLAHSSSCNQTHTHALRLLGVGGFHCCTGGIGGRNKKCPHHRKHTFCT